MSLVPKEVKVLLDPDLHRQFSMLCEASDVGLAAKGAQLIAEYVAAEEHRYRVLRRVFQDAGTDGVSAGFSGKVK